VEFEIQISFALRATVGTNCGVIGWNSCHCL